MLYRIQTVYIILAFLGLLIVNLGFDMFTLTSKSPEQFDLISHANVYGVQKDLNTLGELKETSIQTLQQAFDKVEITGKESKVPTYKFPFYIFTILLSLIAILVVLKYKNTKQQLGSARLFFVLNLLTFIVMLVLYYRFKGNASLESLENITELSGGFYGLCISVAFSFLGLLGIKRDYKVIKSIDRIR